MLPRLKDSEAPACAVLGLAGPRPGLSRPRLARLRKSSLAVACAAFYLVSGRFAAATPAELVGPGPESIALAGAGVALELGPEAVVQNPAGLARLREKQLLVGYRASRFTLELERDGRAESVSADLAHGLFVGVAAPFGNEDVRAALGIYAETPPDFIVRADLPAADAPHFPLLVGRAQALDLGVGLAGGVGSLSFGAGVRVLAALSSQVTGRGRRRGSRSELSDVAPAGTAIDLGARGRRLAVRGVFAMTSM